MVNSYVIRLRVYIGDEGIPLQIFRPAQRMLEAPSPPLAIADAPPAPVVHAKLADADVGARPTSSQVEAELANKIAEREIAKEEEFA